MAGPEQDAEVRREWHKPSPAAPSLPRLGWAALPVVLAFAAVLVSWALGPGPRRESMSLLMALQVVSLLAGLLVVHLAAASFRLSGSMGALWLGCGALFWSCTGLVAVLVGHDDPNRIVGLHNRLAWLSGACHLAGVVVSTRRRCPVRRRVWTAALWYVAVFTAIALIVWGARAGLLPAFFVEGEGGTPIRQVVLASTVLMFALAAALLAGRPALHSSPFRRWYSLALALAAVGFLALLLQTRLGSVVNWLGRGIQVMAGLYLLVAAAVGVRESLAVVLLDDASLREAEHRYRVMVDSSPDAIIVHQDGRIVYANSAALRLCSGRAADVLGREILDLVHVEDRAMCAARMRHLDEGGGLPAYELRLLRGDGTVIHVEATGSSVMFGAGRAGQMILRDVSERRRAEDVLRRSESRLALLSRTAARLLASPDPQDVLPDLCREVMERLDCQAFFNSLVEPGTNRLRLKAWAGLSQEQAQRLGQIDEAQCACLRHGRQEMFATPVPLSCEGHAGLRAAGIQVCCCHRLMGQTRCLGALSFARRTARPFAREEVEVMNVVADQVATAFQRMQARRELCEANARLLEADRRKNEFLAVLSHELRNPLAPITNSLRVLERAEPGSEVASRAGQVIARQVEQLSRLVGDLLDVTRITRNKISLNLEALDLNEVVQRAADDNRFLFEHAGLALEVRLWPQALRVRGDRTRLTQVVGNLLHNAAKFSMAGGRTRVVLSVAEGQARVCVEDDGVGMSATTMSSLFVPFAQAEQTLDRSSGGLGLGLSLVKSLLEMHGGAVHAHSAGLGHGSQFTVELPLHETAAPVVVPMVALPSTRRRVLIIEDNLDSAESLRAVLEMEQHEVAVAHNGPDGLAEARRFRPEVVLCDIGLPGMDGYDVARAFRADEQLRQAFLVALSGYAAPEDLARASAAGFHRHMAKPPHMETLSELLAST